MEIPYLSHGMVSKSSVTVIQYNQIEVIHVYEPTSHHLQAYLTCHH
jgi:hypothetical protein